MNLNLMDGAVGDSMPARDCSSFFALNKRGGGTVEMGR
jgi:hypothetical protein